MRLLLTIIVVAICPIAARGAEIALRGQATLAGSIVRLGDVADLSSADEAETAELAAVPLLPAPAPGTQFFLDAAKIRQLLSSAGVDVRKVQIRGARSVAVNSPAIDVEPTTTEPQQPATATGTTTTRITPGHPEREAVAVRVGAAIVAYLRQQTGHDLWNVEVTPDNDVVDLDWHFGPQITVSGGQAPWTGRQRFDLAGNGSNKHAKTFAAVERVETVAFAVRQINVGDFVRATDVELKTFSGNIPSQAATTLETIVGKEAMQAIRPGTMVLSNQVRAPRLVHRGERVSVRARAAGIMVHTYATAQQDGSLGDLIAVQALEGKDRFAARVSGLRELEVLAAGVSAADIVTRR